MQTNEIEFIKTGTVVIDNKTGEEFSFNKFEYPYALCLDKHNITYWIPYERIELK